MNVDTNEVSEINRVHEGVIPRISREAENMRLEVHSWLQWPGCSIAQHIRLNNRLALLQNKRIQVPVVVDWEVFETERVIHELKRLFGSNFGMPIWERMLSVKEGAYREWCLEFYSSVKVEKNEGTSLYTIPMVSFRLGGKDHHVSLPLFGYLAGIFSLEEANQFRNIRSYLLVSDWESNRAEIDGMWNEISCTSALTHSSEQHELRTPVLRLAHGILVSSFFQRSRQTNKVLPDEVWILHKLSKGDRNDFINAPWVLAKIMESIAVGRDGEPGLGCGNFVTRIARNLGLVTNENIMRCSPEIHYRTLFGFHSR